MGKSGNQATAAPQTFTPQPLTPGQRSGMAVDYGPMVNYGPSSLSMAAPQPQTRPTPTPAAPSGSNVFGQVQGYQSQAAKAYGGLTGIKPTSIMARGVSSGGKYDPAAVQAGTLAQADYQQYMNPYTQQVIERGEQDVARQREQALNALGAQATAAGAFGGSRFGLSEGETYGQYGRMAADMAAQQRQAAFQQAQQAAQFDIGTQYEAQRANELARQQAFEDAARRKLTASQASAANALQASMANQQAAINAAQMQQAGAAGLAGLGQQAFGQGMAVQSQIAQQAAQQRAIQQQMLDAQRAQVMGATGAPLAGLGTLSQILGATPYDRTTTTSQPFNPASLLSVL